MAMTEKTPRKVHGDGRGRSAGQTERAANAAFDLWLERKLHDMFDSVAAEPLPEDLLRVIAQLDNSLPKK
jgi:hypothetical protein